MPPRIPLAFLATRAHCWPMGNLLSTSTPRSFSAELPPAGQPQPVLVHWGCHPPQVQDPTLAFVELHEVPLCPALQPAQVSLNGSAASGESAAPPSSVSPANLLRVPQPLHPGHWWVSWTGLDPVLTLGNTARYSLQPDSAPLITALWALPFSQFSIHLAVLTWPTLPELTWEGVMGDRVKSLAEFKADNIHCSPLHPPSQPFHHRRLSGWSGMISKVYNSYVPKILVQFVTNRHYFIVWIFLCPEKIHMTFPSYGFKHTTIKLT